MNSRNQVNPSRAKTGLFAMGFVVLASTTSGCLHMDFNGKVPEDWYLFPEDAQQAPKPKNGKTEPPRTEDQLAIEADKLFANDAESLAQIDDFKDPSADLSTVGKPKDWTPWHLEFFMTDLSVSASGVLGHLLLKGTPGVSAIWRKQYPKAAADPGAPSPEALTPDLIVNSLMTQADLSKQIEPLVRGVMATGKVKDEAKLRLNLLTAAQQLQDVTSGLDSASFDSSWWVSRVRMDLAVEASAAVTPIITAGAEVKLRFEWHRVMKTTNALATSARSIHRGGKPGESLKNLVEAMAADLEDLSSEGESLTPTGFKAYGFRAGVGMSNIGMFGVAKSTTTTTLNVYFNRDVKKPVVNPKPKLVDPSQDPILLVEDGTAHPEHAKFAAANNVAFDQAGNQGISPEAIPLNLLASVSKDPVVYKFSHEEFRKSLRKATQISGFFVKRAATSHQGQWKVHELRTAFDLSITGKSGLSWATANATTEINFYNQDF